MTSRKKSCPGPATAISTMKPPKALRQRESGACARSGIVEIFLAWRPFSPAAARLSRRIWKNLCGLFRAGLDVDQRARSVAHVAAAGRSPCVPPQGRGRPSERLTEPCLARSPSRPAHRTPPAASRPFSTVLPLPARLPAANAPRADHFPTPKAFGLESRAGPRLTVRLATPMSWQ